MLKNLTLEKKITNQIPIIDIGKLQSNETQDLEEIADNFIKAYSTVGFSYIVNHNIDQRIIDDVFIASKEFHSLPRKEKQKIELNHLHRGFIPINSSTEPNSDLANTIIPNQSESFIMMRDAQKDDLEVINNTYLAGPNIWPENVIHFKERTVRYAEAMTELCAKLTSIITKGIGITQPEFISLFEVPTIWLRLLYYPSQSQSSYDNTFGSAPHRDFGGITILSQDQIGGLQVKTRSGEWLDAPEIPGTFVVNVGNMLHRLSNGFLMSTPHRVINKSNKERYSCPFFFDPNVNATIKPLGNYVNKKNPAKFNPMIYGDYLKNELSTTYNQHKD